MQREAVVDRAERALWAKVDKNGPLHPALGTRCWIWTGARTGSGYGTFMVNGVTYATHRLAWTLAHGAIPAGMWICHHCDTPLCVRAEHLFLGTNSDNMHDAVRKGRKLPHSMPGEQNPLAKLTYADVLVAREAFQRGTTYRELARRFSVTPTTISSVVRGRSWRASGVSATK